jgi:hypothetical protein
MTALMTPQLARAWRRFYAIRDSMANSQNWADRQFMLSYAHAIFRIGRLYQAQGLRMPPEVLDLVLRNVPDFFNLNQKRQPKKTHPVTPDPEVEAWREADRAAVKAKHREFEKRSKEQALAYNERRLERELAQLPTVAPKEEAFIVRYHPGGFFVDFGALTLFFSNHALERFLERKLHPEPFSAERALSTTKYLATQLPHAVVIPAPYEGQRAVFLQIGRMLLGLRYDRKQNYFVILTTLRCVKVAWWRSWRNDPKHAEAPSFYQVARKLRSFFP